MVMVMVVRMLRLRWRITTPSLFKKVPERMRHDEVPSNPKQVQHKASRQSFEGGEKSKDVTSLIFIGRKSGKGEGGVGATWVSSPSA